MNKQKYKKNAGFTLVELLLVVVIISVLSGLVLSVINVSGLRAKSRDAQRMADLEKLGVALELHYSDNRNYPDTSSNWINITGADVLSSELADYIDNVPVDPINDTASAGPCADETANRYSYVSNGQTYILTSIMEVQSTNDQSECVDLSNWGDLVATCPSDETADFCYGVQNPK